MKLLLRAALWFAILLAHAWPLTAAPAGTAFTYQGRLQDADGPANGHYDFLFRLYDAPASGKPIGPLLATNAVAVNSGLFAVELDFGAGAFAGEARWLHISVQTNGAGRFTTLTPRQPLTSAPSAHYAHDSGAAAYATVAGGLCHSNLTFTAENTLALTAREIAMESDRFTNTVGGSATRTVGQHATETVGGDLNLAVGNVFRLATASDVTTMLGRQLTTTVAGDCVLAVGSNMVLTAGQNLNIEVEDEILLKTGDASIRMKKSGEIRIQGKDIIIQGSGKILIRSNDLPELTLTAAANHPAAVGADLEFPAETSVCPAQPALVLPKRSAGMAGEANPNVGLSSRSAAVGAEAALATVHGMQQRVEGELARLRAENAALTQELAELKRVVQQFAKRSGDPP